jgi:hypothetical protein
VLLIVDVKEHALTVSEAHDKFFGSPLGRSGEEYRLRDDVDVRRSGNLNSVVAWNANRWGMRGKKSLQNNAL